MVAKSNVLNIFALKDEFQTATKARANLLLMAIKKKWQTCGC